MLESNTAYPITVTNVNVLSHLSGKTPNLLMANIGWCATYSENRVPRWMIVPKSSAVKDMGFAVNVDTFP